MDDIWFIVFMIMVFTMLASNGDVAIPDWSDPSNIVLRGD